jgi:hypothetical protein
MKDDVLALAKSNHIFLGQILATTDHSEFWDIQNGNSRLKQYQLEKYLRAIDDGWVLRKGQYYRGAFQAEDEEAWGIEFYKWLLADDTRLQSQYFLIRQSIRDIPHRGDDSKTLQIRAVSKTISDAYTPFMDLRVKIHGQPQASDIAKVISFRELHRAKLSQDLLTKFETLISDMRTVYEVRDLESLRPLLKAIPKEHELSLSLSALIDTYTTLSSAMSRSMLLAENILAIRNQLTSIKGGTARLALLDVSIRLEELFVAETSAWQPATVAEVLDKVCFSGMTATGAGFLELWEWDAIVTSISNTEDVSLRLDRLQEFFETGRNAVEWGTAMVRAVYADVISLYTPFEPLAVEFQDDRIRGSALLPLGESVGVLGNVIAVEAKLSNTVLDIPAQQQIRGLNPGYAKGELVVISGDAEEIEVSPDKIYIFERPPADLKPVAGIATVSEGNMVSHVQLLARNLGIPNAVVSQQNLNALKAYAGTQVFYAVSKKGTVLMKKASAMTAAERELFAVKTRSNEKVRVPVDKIDLNQTRVLNMRAVNASHSGKLCGPKAANLGQLKALFPDHVVEGIVIPFGIFRGHMDQAMPGQSVSYWNFLQEIFKEAEAMKTRGNSASDVEAFTLGKLQILRDAIKTITFSANFTTDLKTMFRDVLGSDPGTLPVFLRSDTNMEDLKDFTGAGLNLTDFNVVEEGKIMQGIRDVWASPYSERIYKWRQSYLLNPVNVFPSFLIIPSVDVECSGVMFTKGVQTGSVIDITIAFSRGAGGAVDGQAAESYLLNAQGKNILLTPAREPTYRTLPTTGGTGSLRTTFENRILNGQKLYALRLMAGDLKRKLPGTPGVESQGPFDIELGFKDGKIYLFQVRPFVENKNALSSDYLESITPKIAADTKIKLDKTL